MTYRPTIGLEVHAELATETKMFCRCKNDPEASEPNVNVCPVCLAHPGSLPAANRDAIYRVLRVGAALGSKLADYSEFDRKSYFYPDIPKGYQITQYEYPFVAGGELAGVAITRVHLEEDTARSSHEGADKTSEVDFNRAGVPLMELVTEPVIHDAKTAGNFARELQQLLRTLGVSHANLEKGEMRIEANISVSKTDVFGTKVEVKNLNSFRSVERAIEFEIARQSKLIDEGGVVSQETRGWDEGKQETFRQRSKEGSADYRYFPEPDLPKILRRDVPEWSDEALVASLPELPAAVRARYQALGMKDEDATFVAYDSARREFFDAVIALLANDTSTHALAINYFTSDLSGLAANVTNAKNDDESEGETTYGKVTPESFAELIRMVKENKLSSRGAKDVLAIMFEKGGNPETLATTAGLMQVSDPAALQEAVRGVLEANPGVVEEYKAGKEAGLQFLLGQSMKATKGAGNPALLRELLLKEIS
ncbi:MAG: Asp-tRNA(Asn)/Glu-tRNA(Gln) amidotransferase subunit GatB [Candidatus Paceibacterota bacterium]